MEEYIVTWHMYINFVIEEQFSNLVMNTNGNVGGMDVYF
jgi:hypothetical protein